MGVGAELPFAEPRNGPYWHVMAARHEGCCGKAMRTFREGSGRAGLNERKYVREI